MHDVSRKQNVEKVVVWEDVDSTYEMAFCKMKNFRELLIFVYRNFPGS